MELTRQDLVARQLQQVEFWRHHQRNVESAMCALRRERRGADVGGLVRLLAELYKRELDAWRGLCMWGLSLDDKERAEVRAKAFARFLRDDYAVMHYLSDDGSSPGAWRADEEEELRRLAKEAFLDADELLEGES